MGEMEKKSIKELEEAMVFGLSIAKAGIDALGDGVDIGDLFAILPVLKLAPEAIKGAEEIPAELADLSDAEVDHLVARVGELLPKLPSHKAKAVALKATQFGLVGVQLFSIVTAPSEAA